jgi:NADH-quinone oxidoreductase subunit N
MLYGVSLLAGVLGSAHIPTMAQELAALDIPNLIANGEGGSKLMVLALGGIMLGVGLAFKLSAVPFHFWCPDVFEGASAEVDAFLSVASKAAALALLLRVGIGLTHMQGLPVEALAVESAAKSQALVTTVAATTVANGVAAATDPLSPVRTFVVTILAIMGMVSCTFGNLAAYGQTNIKRMLAYSTIAHAGYMILAVAAAIALLGRDVTEAHSALSALLFYVTIYLFMNLGAFAVIAFLRNEMQSEEIDDYAGLIRSAPIVAVMMTMILISLIGIPPMAGFWPKLRVLQALYEAGGTLMITALVVLGLNTAISLVYYLRVVKKMCMDPESDSRGPVSLGFLPVAYVLMISAPVLIFGLMPDWLARWADQAAQQFFS